MIPTKAERVLSVGAGFNQLELSLRDRGATVTALPLDSVVGAILQRNGIEVIYGSLAECFEAIRQRSFDCVLISNLLHLLPNPWHVLQECCARLTDKSGSLIVAGPNFGSLSVLVRRFLGQRDYASLGGFSKIGIHPHLRKTVARQIEREGLRVVAKEWTFRPESHHPSAKRRKLAPRIDG